MKDLINAFLFLILCFDYDMVHLVNYFETLIYIIILFNNIIRISLHQEVL